MRYLLLCIWLFVWSCAGEAGSSKDQGEETTADITLPSGSAASAIAPLASKEVDFLTTNYWVFEFYVIPGNRKESMANRGRWYNFNEDGTFVSGQWQETTGKGTWRVFPSDLPYYDTTIHIDAENDVEDSEFFLKFNEDGSAGAWVGTKTFNQSAIQAKVENLMSMPTKAQYGLE